MTKGGKWPGCEKLLTGLGLPCLEESGGAVWNCEYHGEGEQRAIVCPSNRSRLGLGRDRQGHG